MFNRIVSMILAASIAVTPALAGPSGQHSARAVDHSGQASDEASAALSSGVGTVAAIPIMALGATIAISGAGLQSVGEEVLMLGDDIYDTTTGERIAPKRVQPNGPPTLD